MNLHTFTSYHAIDIVIQFLFCFSIMTEDAENIFYNVVVKLNTKP